MARPTSPDLYTQWKVHLSATVAGAVEFLLMDAVHSKPIFGARKILLERLLQLWLAEQDGRIRIEIIHVDPSRPAPEPPPSLAELRNTINA